MAPINITSAATSLIFAEVATSPQCPQKKKFQSKQVEPAPIQSPSKARYSRQIVWRNVIAFVYLHTASVYGLYLFIFRAQIYTVLWTFLLGSIGAMGITAGAHRLWAHKAYKARWPMRLFLALCQTLAFQNTIYDWVRDHRVHHKFTDTDADPHNAARGFFFSHIGWLMLRKHEHVKNKGKTVDLSDLDKDWIVTFQRKYYLILMPLFCFVIPVWVPCFFWKEDFSVSWHCAGVLRYTLSLNFTWFVNSAAHIWGMKPYDRFISAADNRVVAALAFGEGWHNYHHAFPWDYKAAELGNYRLNLSTALIDLCARLGLAYDLKAASPELVERRARRTGDGSHLADSNSPDDLPHPADSGAVSGSTLLVECHPRGDGSHPAEGASYLHPNNHHQSHENSVWGWDDENMSPEELKLVKITNKSHQSSPSLRLPLKNSGSHL